MEKRHKSWWRARVWSNAVSNDRGLVYKSIKGRWWPPSAPSPATPAAARAYTSRRACLCTAQGQTRLRDRWSNTLHTSLPVCNMSSSPATAGFPLSRKLPFFGDLFHLPLPPSLSLFTRRDSLTRVVERS